MSKQEIIDILKANEQVLYLPKGMRKNPMTYGFTKHNYDRIADEIMALYGQDKPVIKSNQI